MRGKRDWALSIQSHMGTAWQQQAPWGSHAAARDRLRTGRSLCGTNAEWSGYMTLTKSGPSSVVDHFVFEMYVREWPHPFV